jgi:hypothetical protein
MITSVRLLTLTLGLLVAPLLADAQQALRLWRVAFLGAESPATSGHFLDAFRQGLRNLGYVEGQTITIEARWAEGRHERFPTLVAELVRLNVAVQEGTCDETPFEGLCFPLSIRNWHFVTKMAQQSFLWSSEYGKTAGSCRQRKFSLCACLDGNCLRGSEMEEMG